MRPFVAVFLLSALAILCGCGSAAGHSVMTTLTAASVFDAVSMTGQTWIFQNGYGDHTFVSIENPPAGFYPGCSVWRYTKDSGRAYWQPGIRGAELRFVLCANTDGSWSAKASLADLGTLQLTQNVEPSGDGKKPYLIIPAWATRGPAMTDATSYRSYIAWNMLTWESVEAIGQQDSIPWRTESSVEDVVTPVYSGPALISEQWESYSGSCFPSEQQGCVHEKWYFAPRLGLVKVVPLDTGTGTMADPKLTMVRNQ